MRAMGSDELGELGDVDKTCADALKRLLLLLLLLVVVTGDMLIRSLKTRLV